MIYIYDPQTQSCDPTALYQELLAVFGPSGWGINTYSNSIEFIITDPTLNLDPSTVINNHLISGSKRESNKVILKQILDLEATVTQRRLREAALGIDNGWLKNLNDEITNLRKGLI